MSEVPALVLQLTRTAQKVSYTEQTDRKKKTPPLFLQHQATSKLKKHDVV